MQTLDVSSSLTETLRQRRQRLADWVKFPVLLWAGQGRSRNFPANRYPFRASSHFLYFAGQPIENAVIHLAEGKLTLFMENPAPSSILWHGALPTREQIATEIGAEAAYPLEELANFSQEAATLPVLDAGTQTAQSQVLNRAIPPLKALQGQDLELATAIVNLRLCHDQQAIAEIQRAAAVTVQAHRTGMAVTSWAKTEAAVRAAMEAEVLSANHTCAYNSIVTVHGEVLHNEHYPNSLKPGDLLLADVGAEAPSGWASDVTRTWPTSGRFSATQRAIYDVVLAAHDACIAQIQPGVEYRTLHQTAGKVIAEGLVDLGIFRCSVETAIDRNLQVLFFPHGVGHLLGLDVHDMEDLGDLAGYAPGRTRSDRFGDCYLRLDRPLQADMVVTIEPGFYQVPALIQDPQWRSETAIDWEKLSTFSDVRGIRIEDDVRVTETGAEVLTADLPTDPEAIEALVQQS